MRRIKYVLGKVHLVPQWDVLVVRGKRGRTRRIKHFGLNKNTPVGEDATVYEILDAGRWAVVDRKDILSVERNTKGKLV